MPYIYFMLFTPTSPLTLTNFSDPSLPCQLHAIFLKLFFNNLLSPICFTIYSWVGAIHWNMIELPGGLTLKRTDSSFTIILSIALQTEVGS